MLPRLAAPRDAMAIAHVQTSCDGGDAESIEPLIRGELEAIERGELRRQTWVVEASAQVIAYARCGYRSYDPAFPELPEGWYLTGIHVLPTHRRKGHGTRLTEARLAFAHAQSSELYYYTGRANHASVALHAPFSFRRIAHAVRAPTSTGPSTSMLFQLEASAPDGASKRS